LNQWLIKSIQARYKRKQEKSVAKEGNKEGEKKKQTNESIKEAKAGNHKKTY
jgi:hypothetical protein